MDTSRTLINAQINFIDDRLRLVHIPLSSYSFHVQTILKLLFPNDGSGLQTTDVPWTSRHPFFNISINSVECSILCSSTLAEKHFGQYMNQNVKRSPSTPLVSNFEFVVISVEGEGLEAGQRVLDLTTPLAMASIPIFFFTTYFCDYILVPLTARAQVVRALEERGFVLESVPGGIDTHVNVAAHHRNRSSAASLNFAQSGSRPSSLPSTPPPTSVSELQARTFALLQKRNIKPKVLSDVRLIQCAGRKNAFSFGLGSKSPANAQELGLQMGIVKCIIHPPRFFSATLTATEPAALLLEESLRQSFFSCGRSRSGGSEEDFLLGGTENPLVPIMLNLEPLPLEATGIVCGVAGRMADATQSGLGAIEMSYLSTARTGTVLVEEKDLSAAIYALGLGDAGIDIG